MKWHDVWRMGSSNINFQGFSIEGVSILKGIAKDAITPEMFLNVRKGVLCVKLVMIAWWDLSV